MAGLTYRDAGVDIEAGDRLVDRIKPHVARTRIPEQIGNLGGFAALCGLPAGMRDPVLVSGTDGVGTKLKVAFAAGRHNTVGIDLVAMCVNDVITTGARPLFFLDYYATAKLDVDTAAGVIEGIAEGCAQAGCALLGGETAELPGLYSPGEYDLAGFSVGVVERDQILDGTAVKEGDAVIGVASAGLHSNGYSLARKALLEVAGLSLDETPEGLDEPLVDALLRPTRIYAKATAALQSAVEVRALCHVTGGGIVGNFPRVLPEGLGAKLDPSCWSVPPIFSLIQRHAEVAQDEMYRAFNMGLGLVVVVPEAEADAAVKALTDAGEQAARVGSVTGGHGETDRIVLGG